jgi:DNA-binding transcriptional ArsR family regulator
MALTGTSATTRPAPPPQAAFDMSEFPDILWLMAADVDVFHALAHPVRRRALELLARGPLLAGELARRCGDDFDLSRPAVAEHVAILKAAHLIVDEKRGRQRSYALADAPLATLREWLQRFDATWQARFDVLADIARDVGDAADVHAAVVNAPVPGEDP